MYASSSSEENSSIRAIEVAPKLSVKIFSCVNPEMQLEIIKRYLHDVRLGNVEMNFSFLQMLRDYRYKTYVDIRYFVENSGSNIDL